MGRRSEIHLANDVVNVVFWARVEVTLGGATFMDIRSNPVALLEPWILNQEVLPLRWVIDILRGVMGAEREFSALGHAPTREQTWQVTRARRLAGLLGARGVAVWHSELPPGL